jgi:hypothetical protein
VVRWRPAGLPLTAISPPTARSPLAAGDFQTADGPLKARWSAGGPSSAIGPLTALSSLTVGSPPAASDLKTADGPLMAGLSACSRSSAKQHRSADGRWFEGRPMVRR